MTERILHKQWVELLVLINQDKASFVNKSKPQIPKNEPYLQKCEKDLQIRFRYFLEKIQFNLKNIKDFGILKYKHIYENKNNMFVYQRNLDNPI